MRVVILGEALLDFIAVDPVPLTEATQFTRCLGGAALNVAVGMHHYGLETAFVSRVGKDQLGRQVMIELGKHGLSTTSIQIDTRRPTKCAFISHDQQGARYIEIANRQSADQHIDLVALSNTLRSPFYLLYISGVMLIREEGLELVEACIRAAKERSALVAFDPVFNVAKSAQSVQDRVASILQFVDVLKVNEAEYEALAGPMTLNGALPKLLLHTKGEKGATIQTENARIDIDAVQTRCVDPTGAGDAFFAAFLARMLIDSGGLPADYGERAIQVWGKEAAQNASRAIQFVGATEGYKSII